jgi:hypothetical protein
LNAIDIVKVATTNSMRIVIMENSGVAIEFVGLASIVGDDVELADGVGDAAGVNCVAVTGGADGFGAFNIGVKLTLPRLKSFF